MTSVELSSGLEGLQAAALKLFKQDGLLPGKSVDAVAAALKWRPTITLNSSNHIHTLVEISEDKVYPQILRLRHAELTQFPEPVAIYVVCPEEIALEASSQTDVRDLESHGFGLIVVNAAGKAHKQFSAIPVVQVISASDYLNATKGLPTRIKQKAAQAFVDYRSRPVMGVVSLTEVVEGLAIRATNDAQKKGWIAPADVNGPLANALDKMYAANGCRNSRAALGGVRNYIANFRNLNHHWPKNRKKAHEKYVLAKHGFLEGLRHVRDFPTAMKNIGLSGLLPPA